jgi:uncharacterized membrane protein SpoIIM required for sporulation/uncharacterized RDD family membrane protein YckC
MSRADPPAVLTSTPLAGDTLLVDTPEAVTIEYALAGLGSRFTALLFDFLWLLVLCAVLPLIVLLIFSPIIGHFIPRGPALALLIIYEFVVLWGYFFCFEAFRDGRTPGKRLLSIRVVMDGGYPVTLRAAAIRNLVRIVDVQPGLTCVVGGFLMLLSGKSRRLGDHAAGTVVVRDMPIEFPEVRAVAAAAAAPLLSDPAFAALEIFADRSTQLAPAARAAVAQQLVRKLIDVPDSRRGSEPPAHYLARLHADESARRQAARKAGVAGSPAATALLNAKRNRWTGFHATVQQARKQGLTSLDENRLVEFAAQYRELSADLARARTYGASPATLFALERLVGAAHNLFYRPARGSLRSVDTWVRAGFPRLVRRLWLPIALSAGMLYGPAALTYAVLRSHPEHERALAGVALIERAETAAATGKDYIDTIEMPWMGNTALSSMLISNNVQVSFMVFAGGVLAGLGSLAILVFNGLMLGAVFAVFANRHVLDTIVMWVAPHGVVELTAIAIAGGAGLWMGSGLLLPGRRARLPCFAERARDAVALVAGVGMLLIVAGLIEGWISPSRLPDPVKLLFSAVIALGLFWYLVFAGRRGEPEHDESPERS